MRCRGFSATDLGGLAIAAALERAGVAADEVDQVVMGHVLTAGEGQSAARNASIKGGVGMKVPATTVNKVCLSGLQAINYGWMLIATGQADVVVAGGMESMTNSPYLLPKGRSGYGYGHGEVLDSLLYDGLTCAIESVLMGEGTDTYAQADNIAREAQDAYAVESHERRPGRSRTASWAARSRPCRFPSGRAIRSRSTRTRGSAPAPTSPASAGSARRSCPTAR